MRLHRSDTWLHRPECPAVAVVGRRPGLAQSPILQRLQPSAGESRIQGRLLTKTKNAWGRTRAYRNESRVEEDRE